MGGVPDGVVEIRTPDLPSDSGDSFSLQVPCELTSSGRPVDERVVPFTLGLEDTGQGSAEEDGGRTETRSIGVSLTGDFDRPGEVNLRQGPKGTSGGPDTRGPTRPGCRTPTPLRAPVPVLGVGPRPPHRLASRRGGASTGPLTPAGGPRLCVRKGTVGGMGPQISVCTPARLPRPGPYGAPRGRPEPPVDA